MPGLALNPKTPLLSPTQPYHSVAVLPAMPIAGCKRAEPHLGIVPLTLIVPETLGVASAISHVIAVADSEVTSQRRDVSPPPVATKSGRALRI